ncbi:TlpA family protein disulfide reductase [Flaviaesturariibacter flavus]|nr:TlpA disulfide reductase family protein [Flaviaesturariibacter flavus]
MLHLMIILNPVISITGFSSFFAHMPYSEGFCHPFRASGTLPGRNHQLLNSPAQENGLSPRPIPYPGNAHNRFQFVPINTMFRRSLVILFLLPLLLQAQQGKPFKIIGTSRQYENQELIVVVGTYPPSFNGCTLSSKDIDSGYNPRTRVENGRFELHGTISYPHPLSVSYYDPKANRGYTSRFYFIDGGPVQINVGDLATEKTLGPRIHTRPNDEYAQLKKLYSVAVDTITGEIIDMPAKQSLMRSYVAAHPDSYVAMWDLLFDLAHARDERVKKSILATAQLLSPAVKETRTCQALIDALNKELALTTGQKFPELQLNPHLSLAGVAKENKYTLIEFWFSHCPPCIDQIPKLKNIHTAYRKKGLGIIGVSVDRQEDEADWKKIIRRFRIEWPQYLDTNGEEARRLYINSFPSSFLLDRDGIIVAKDLSPEELTVFLEKNLDQ